MLTVEALNRGDTQVVTPIDFFHLIWATLPGSLFSGESIDNLVWIFGAVAISSVSYIVWCERQIVISETSIPEA